MPPPRYTVHHHATTGSWYVYDRLRNHQVRIDASAVSATNIARDYEADWRRQCTRWQEAEWRGGSPYVA